MSRNGVRAMSSAEAPGTAAVSSLDGGWPVAGNSDYLDENLNDWRVARLPGLIADKLQLPEQAGLSPPDLMVMPVRQRPAQSAEPDDVGVAGGSAEDQRVPASHREPDAVVGGQAFQRRSAQRQVPAVLGDGLALEQRGHHLDDCGQPLGSFARRGPVPADV